VQGTGLGLKIIYDIADSYGGNVFLASPPKGYSTCFRLEVPAAKEEDLEAYDV
jgi:signal transduction histidine kinase